jgi:hypothetical protein
MEEIIKKIDKNIEITKENIKQIIIEKGLFSFSLELSLKNMQRDKILYFQSISKNIEKDMEKNVNKFIDKQVKDVKIFILQSLIDNIKDVRQESNIYGNIYISFSQDEKEDVFNRVFILEDVEVNIVKEEFPDTMI